MCDYVSAQSLSNNAMNDNLAPLAPVQLNAALRRGESPVLLDVRTPLEYQEVHLPGSRLIPLDELDAGAVAREHGSAGACVVICRSGSRAKKAADKLAAAGMANLQILEGGMQAWAEAGLPTNCGRKVMSLERQVRIAAGAIVLGGVLLAQFVNPAFAWLSGFVGAGLMIAGITDWCGMGMLIAKAPWNRVPKSAATTPANAATPSCCG